MNSKPLLDDRLKRISIQNKMWAFKDTKKGNFFNYRCPNRTSSGCDAYMYIHKPQLDRILRALPKTICQQSLTQNNPVSQEERIFSAELDSP